MSALESILAPIEARAKETTEDAAFIAHSQDVPTLIALARSQAEALQTTTEALDWLSLICTCDRPTKRLPGGGAQAPGDHTAKCVRTIAKTALAAASAVMREKREETEATKGHP